MVWKICSSMVVVLLAGTVWAQKEAIPYQKDFPPEEFSERREAVYDAIGSDAMALLQGAANPLGYITFRQDNNFYYLSGVESPHAYLLLDGASRTASLYLLHINEQREAREGLQLSADNADLVSEVTGIEHVYGNELLGAHLAEKLEHPGHIPTLYTQRSPAENYASSRDMALRSWGDIANDPWDGRPSRSSHFSNLLKQRFPQFDIQDLTPIIDRMRLIKSPAEIEMMRRTARASGLGLMEAMRSTQPGRYEYELDAVAKLIFYRMGAQGDAYYSLVASGTNAWINHYNSKDSRMEDGELVLMDYAPDIGYYVTDITRMWPVGGKFNAWQREIYQFYLDCHTAILESIKPGITASAIMQTAAAKMEAILEETKFSEDFNERAARGWVQDYSEHAQDPNASLGHWLGMTAHDDGFDHGPLRPGMLFTVEPDIRVPEKKQFIGIEDVVLITEEGVEILSAFVPKTIDDIEAIMQEEGVLDRWPLQPASNR